MNVPDLPRYDFLNRFWQLALTNILSYIMLPLAGLISVALLGHQGNIHTLAGVTSATVLFEYAYGILSFFRMGTTGVTAQAVGRDDRSEILLVGLRNGLIAIAIGLLLIVLQYPLREIGLTILNPSHEVKLAASDYFNTRIWGFPAVLLNAIVVGWLLGQEQNSKVLLMSFIGNAANIALNYLFIVQFKWASAGAGLSATLSDGLTLLLGLGLVLQNLRLTEIREVATKVWDWSAFQNIFRLTTNLVVRSICSMSVFPIFTSLGSALGTDVLASNALLIQIFLLSVFFCEGLGLATETLAGNFQGQKEPEQLLPLLQVAGGSSLLIALSFSGAAILFPETLLGLLTNHVELIAQAKAYVPWLLSFLTFSAVAFLLDGYFVALLQSHIVRNATITGVVLGFLPLAAIAGYTHNNHFLWLAMSVYMAIRALLLLLQVPRTLKNDVVNLETA